MLLSLKGVIPMIVRRSIPLCIIFSIITCGIYTLYWFVCVTNEVDAVTGESGPGGGLSLLLTIITCGIYGLYWGWKTGDKLDASRARHGVAPGSFAILFLILNLFELSIVTLAIAQNELNRYTPNI